MAHTSHGRGSSTGRGGARVSGCVTEKCVTDAIERLCAARLGSVTPDNMKSLLFSYDGNADGRLEFAELKALLTDADALAPFVPGKVPTAIIDKMDTNGDRAINWEEFVAVSPQYAGASAPAGEAAPSNEVALLNRILRPGISARKISAVRAPSAAIDQASAQVKSSSFPIVPVAVGAALLGAFFLLK